MTQKKPTTVSLVLGSGGARGLAHIGVIEWLLENNYEIRSISGTSMGALIGGIYAAGQLDTYKKWVTALDKTDVVRLLDLSFGWGGLFKGERLIEKLRDLIGDRQIADLPVSFTAVATDIEKAREVWISSGSLFDAIRASIAIPLIFTPYELNGKKLLDGALLNPLPIAPTLRDHTDITIAVNVDGRPGDPNALVSDDAADENENEQDVDSYKARIKHYIAGLQKKFAPNGAEKLDYFDVISMSIDTMQNAIVRMKLAAYTPDYLLVISRDAARAYEFYRAAELIKLGRCAARKNLPTG